MIQRELARGGMGTVYIAWDKLFGREVALKTIHESENQTVLKSRFVTEARITGQLQHPSVPPVFDLGRLADGRPFMAMKWIRGHPWNVILNARARPDEDLLTMVGIFLNVCRTVGYAHSRGIIHRDLKPGNIIVGELGEVQVMDWGLAKRIASVALESETTPVASEDFSDRMEPAPVTMCGEVLGTIAYMSPEQGNGELDRIDRRSDVFSLGAILCEILTGQSVYARARGSEMLKDVRDGNLEQAFAELNRSEIDQRLARIAWSCLSINRAERPEDANELAESIQEYLFGLDGTNKVFQDAILRAREFEKYKADKLKAEIERLNRKIDAEIVTRKNHRQGFWYREIISTKALYAIFAVIILIGYVFLRTRIVR